MNAMDIPPVIHDQLRLLSESADAMERSWSITADETERRFLFFFETTQASVQMVRTAARALDVPEALIDAWGKALPSADAIGLAIRDDLQSVRLYTQYWDALVSMVNNGMAGPALLYAGFKALPDASTRIDSYVCQPGADRREFMPDISASLECFGAESEAVATAFADLSASKCIFTRTASEARKSWLATVRRAELSRTTMATALTPITARIPFGDEVARAAASSDMVHIAAGKDAAKGVFTTLYFESDAAALEAFLNR
mgnify:CR=1 FL=1